VDGSCKQKLLALNYGIYMPHPRQSTIQTISAIAISIVVASSRSDWFNVIEPPKPIDFLPSIRKPAIQLDFRVSVVSE
jgi:hypothetical protein